LSGWGNGAAVTRYDNHGTACAGIIGAIGKGIAGVAPNCKIMPARASTSNGGYNLDWLAAAIEWAWENGADVISNSWGGSSPYTPITNAINNAVTKGRGNKGCVVVVSSGNNNATVSYPASLPNVIAVGAIDRCGIRSGRKDIIPISCDPWPSSGHPGSAYGTALDVVAPGTNIYTTDRQSSAGYHNAPSPIGDYHVFGGTSAACPFVAGVAALVLSVYPNFTGTQVRDIIERTAQKINPSIYSYSVVQGRPNGSWNSQMGHGLVNAYHAVREAQIAACPTQVVNFTNQTVSTNTIITNCAHINVQNVTVTNNKLTIDALGSVTINGPFEVKSGAQLEVK